MLISDRLSAQSGVLQKARQICLGIVHNVGQPVGAIAEECRYIRSVPAALRHPRRQSAEEAKPGQSLRGCQDCRDQAVISVQDGDGPAFIKTDQKYSARVGVVAERTAHVCNLREKCLFAGVAAAEGTQAFDDGCDSKIAARELAP